MHNIVWDVCDVYCFDQTHSIIFVLLFLLTVSKYIAIMIFNVLLILYHMAMPNLFHILIWGHLLWFHFLKYTAVLQ